MIREWKILERKPLEDHKIFKIHTKVVQSPRTGAPMEVKAISLRDWVIALPLTSEGEVVMVRQYRHESNPSAWNCRAVWSIRAMGPRGTPQNGNCGEGTGYVAPDFMPLGVLFSLAGRIGEPLFFLSGGRCTRNRCGATRPGRGPGGGFIPAGGDPVHDRDRRHLQRHGATRLLQIR